MFAFRPAVGICPIWWKIGEIGHAFRLSRHQITATSLCVVGLGWEDVLLVMRLKVDRTYASIHLFICPSAREGV